MKRSDSASLADETSCWRVQNIQFDIQCLTNNRAKRAFDIIAVSLALLFLSPLLVSIAAFIKLADGGRVLYGHKRVGRYGRLFSCWKFRTMVANGDEVLNQYLRDHPDALVEWQTSRKLQNDPRITMFGRVLRKLSLDELPQLFNILLGEMSLVGPRPVVSDELTLYGVNTEFYLRARPGLTGLWQVSGRSDVSYAARVAYDRHYLENWTFLSDLTIIVRTIPAVCFTRGSF